MERLPDELLLLVAEQCDFATLKTLRLIKHHFNALTTPGVFEHFYMGFFERDFLNLYQLTRRSLAQHVRTITFFPDVMPQYTCSEWKEEIDQRQPFPDYWQTCLQDVVGDSTFKADEAPMRGWYYRKAWREYDAMPKHDYSDDRLDQGWQAYKAYIEEHKTWPRKHYDLVFEELLTKLPNLAKINVRSPVHEYEVANNWPVWKRIRESALVAPPFQWLERNLTAVVVGSVLAAVGRRSSSPGSRHIKTLHIEAFNIWPAIGGISECNKYSATEPLVAFQHITSMHLHVPEATSAARKDGPDNAATVMKCLLKARALRKLDLRYSDDNLLTADPACSLESMFVLDKPIWPEIEELSLVVDISAMALIKFLSHHASTLRTFKLQDCHISNVARLIDAFPKTIKVDNLYLKFLWDKDEGDNYHCFLARGTDFDAPYESAFKAYLMCHNASMPEIKRDGRYGYSQDWEDNPTIIPGLFDESDEDEDFRDSEEDLSVVDEDEFETGVEGGDDEAEEGDEHETGVEGGEYD